MLNIFVLHSVDFFHTIFSRRCLDSISMWRLFLRWWHFCSCFYDFLCRNKFLFSSVNPLFCFLLLCLLEKKNISLQLFISDIPWIFLYIWSGKLCAIYNFFKPADVNDCLLLKVLIRGNKILYLIKVFIICVCMTFWNK